MALVSTRRISALGPELILAPERWDSRAILDADGPPLSEIFSRDIASLTPKRVPPGSLVLDCGSAFEGIILTRPSGLPTHPRSSKTLLNPGDVIISRLRPYLRQVALIDDALFQCPVSGQPRAVVCSAEFYVFRQKQPDGVLPASLVPFLLSEEVQAVLAAAQSGSHHPRVPRDVVFALPWPYGSTEEAQRIARQVIQHTRAIRSGMNALSQL